MAEKKPEKYKLKEVCIRLAEGRALYSEQPLSSPAVALDVMRREMSQYDREDITTTRKVIEAGKIMGIPCVDHIVIGGGNGNFCSLREQQLADFSNQIISMTVEDTLRVADNKPIYEGGTKEMPENARDSQVPDFVQEAEAQMAKEARVPKREEVTIKFGKGLAEPFQSKDGREFTRITIPNQEPADKTHWASFVLPAKAVHENQYGKGLWAKIPADGTTVVTKPVLKGQDEQGKNIWEDQKTMVPNRELKGMVEAYKTRSPQTRDQKAAEPRESAREKLDALVKDTAAKLSPEKTPKAKSKSRKGPEL